ncbi:prolyl oligopeptidase family serine peptidase [Georgenia sp. Z1344]|uniref:prolyl oligopeptidase family serine peptidase n=1 Tax=Georgenia sp. Z1344 TaxID=3416706 RepID=UPI003CF75EA0
MTSTAQAQPDDAHEWLEEVEGADALAWVEERNAEVTEEIASTTRFDEIRSEILEVLDSTEKIPAVVQRGEHLYNYWIDAEHPRGLWRRTTWESYRTREPEWDVLLDVDALGEAEGEQWVWHGARVRRPDFDRALVSLSRGGSDADVVREFDLTTREFVEDGFRLEESKGFAAWGDASGDVLLVGRDLGEGSLTESGYPRTVRRWARGTDLADAPELFAGEVSDVAVAASYDSTPGFERTFVSRAVGFFDEEIHLEREDGSLVRIDVPTTASVDVHREWLTILLRETGKLRGTMYRAGTLLGVDLEEFLAGEGTISTLFVPTPTTALSSYAWTRHHLVLNVLEDVTNRLELRTPPPTSDGEWLERPLALSAAGSPRLAVSRMASMSVAAVDELESDDVWLTTADFLQPSSLNLVRLSGAGQTKAVEPLKMMPQFFDDEDLVVEQFFATSDDGTQVPYFQVGKAGVGTAEWRRDGGKPQPTLLYGYGGFEISLLPSYSGSVGRAWLERGGVYVVANIRGGGEYGPRWHRTALTHRRHRAYQDFAAVADDLVNRQVTDPAHLGIQGGSNGGLLMGVMLTLYPEKFGAVVAQVPLLDMKRFSHLLAGASWVAEYGDPDDPQQWSFIKTFSPYHLFDADKDYPPLLLTTSTRDDRVHPGHARKMAAQMLEAGKDVRSYENIEGGHGGAATNAQRAYLQALAYEFLWQQLGD